MTKENLPIPLPNTKQFSKEIWFLHGANATPSSFNYIRNELEKDPFFNDVLFTDIKYDCQDKLPGIVKALSASLPIDRELYLVGHSLGGVLSVAVSQRVIKLNLPGSIKGVVTMGSPFGGSESADYLRWLYPNYHLFKSIHTKNKMILDMQEVGAVVPTLSLVTSGGNNPLFSRANDGVVTINSQRALADVRYVEVPFNHFEVLVEDTTVEHIRTFISTK